MSITSLVLTLGSEVFIDFEVPEQLEGLGGTQVVAQHDFPGGFRTQQRFGAFPTEVRWRGLFTGTSALARMRQVDRLRVAGQEVQLTYGDTLLNGTVVEFVATPRHQWLVPYRIVFLPRFDANAVSPFDDILSTFTLIMDAISHLSTLLQVILPAPTDGPKFSAMDNQQQFYVSLPPTIAPPLTTLLNDTTDALQAALGLPNQVSFNDAQTVYNDANAVYAVTNPLALSADPTLASPALDVNGYVNSIVQGISTPTTGNVTVLNATNPNIAMLASQYYGDASLWETITEASGLPPDPLPVGQFVLTIPAVIHG